VLAAGAASTAVDIDTLPVQRDAAPEPVADVSAAEVLLHFGEGSKARRWRVRGLAKNLAYEVLKVNVLAGCGEAFHVDTFDLYAARARAQFIAQAAGELGVSEDVLKADLGRVLLKLEALQDAQIQAALAPKKSASAAPTLSLEEYAAALGLLRSPDMAARILADQQARGLPRSHQPQARPPISHRHPVQQRRR
jgi:DNA primase